MEHPADDFIKVGNAELEFTLRRIAYALELTALQKERDFLLSLNVPEDDEQASAIRDAIESSIEIITENCAP